MLAIHTSECSPSLHDRHDAILASRSKATASNVVVVLLKVTSECTVSLMEQHVVHIDQSYKREKQRATVLALLIPEITAAAGRPPQQH